MTSLWNVQPIKSFPDKILVLILLSITLIVFKKKCSKHSYWYSGQLSTIRITWVHPLPYWGLYCSICSFACNILATMICLFPFFIWSLHYVILWVTGSSYPCNIYNPVFVTMSWFFFISGKSWTVDLQHFNLLIMSVIRRVFPLWIRYSRFAITRVIVLESSYLFLTEGMYTSGYITVNVTKRLKNWKKLCILIQTKSDLLELFYLAFYIARYRWILWDLYFYFISWMTVIINKFSVLYSKM
jgi:hypothetical protein